VPPHWFRPLNPDPHPLKPNEEIVTRVKSKDGKRRFAITSCPEKPDPDAVFLRDDDLEKD
jgi:hypothetical protein